VNCDEGLPAQRVSLGDFRLQQEGRTVGIRVFGRWYGLVGGPRNFWAETNMRRQRHVLMSSPSITHHDDSSTTLGIRVIKAVGQIPSHRDTVVVNDNSIFSRLYSRIDFYLIRPSAIQL
jgi:hypothetical protein